MGKNLNLSFNLSIKGALLSPENRTDFIRGCRVKKLAQPTDVTTYHAAEVATHKDMVERGQFEVGGPQVPGQLQTFTVRHTAAPVGCTQRARTRRAFI